MAALTKKTAVVTGSTSGIGQGMAEALAGQGANIMLNGLGDPAKIEAQRAGMETKYGVKVAYHPADMTKPAEITDMIAKTVSTFGSIDILINNAGIQHVAPIEDFPPEKWDQIIAINLSSSFHSIRAAVPFMKKQGWGRIIQLASAHALVASPFKSAYVAAKHGIAGLTKTVALEVAESKITCNAICPGYVWTPLVAGQIADTAKARGMSEDDVKNKVILAAQPTHQFTTTEQVGSYVVFLCSPGADNITGAMLTIDGGWTAA
jgi:3-hydroxybutyrate dehydrogenase